MNVESEQKFVVQWQYHNTVLEKWLSVVGLTREEAKKLKRDELLKRLAPVMELVGAKSIPAPDMTSCNIYDEAGESIALAFVTRRPGEPHNKNKARIYALTKALKNIWDGYMYRGIRTAFWKAYWNRANVVNIAPVEEKGELVA